MPDEATDHASGGCGYKRKVFRLRDSGLRDSGMFGT